MHSAVKSWVRVAAVANAADVRPQDGRNFTENVQNSTPPTHTTTAAGGGVRQLHERDAAKPVDHLMPVDTRYDAKGLSRYPSGREGGESAEPHTPERRRRRPRSTEQQRQSQSTVERPQEPQSVERRPKETRSQLSRREGPPLARESALPARAGRRLAEAVPAAPQAAPPRGRSTDSREPATRAASDRSVADMSKLNLKLQAALKNSARGESGKKGAPIMEQINSWTNDDINRAFNGPEAFYAIYSHEPSRNSDSSSNNSGKNFDLYTSFEQLSDTRHLTKGVQDYVKWANGLTPNNRLGSKEQAGNLINVEKAVSNNVKRALDREKVESVVLSGNIDGVLLDPAIWKYATSQSLVALQGTRSGTRGVGRALIARLREKESAPELQRYYTQPGTTLTFLKKFSIKELNYQNPNVLNGWYALNERPASGAEMRPIMVALDPAVLINSGKAQADSRFVQDTVKLQLKERSPSELTGVAAVLWKYASDASNMDARKAGPKDHTVKWFFESFVTRDTQANLGQAMSLYAREKGVDWTALRAARTPVKTNNGLSIATAMKISESAPRLTKAPQANDNVPQLSREERNLTDFFNLGKLTECVTDTGQSIAGRLTFANAPLGRCFTKEELPQLLEGFNYERFVERLKPEEQGLNTPLTYGGNHQDFSLGIIALSFAFRFPQPNWFRELFARCIFQPVVVGWDWRRKTGVPAFYAVRWTPGATEAGFGGPKREQVVDISVTLEEFKRAKRAIGVRAELHFDFAWDIRRKRPQFFVRGEGNMKAGGLGVLWAISRAWRTKRGRGRGAGGGDANGDDANGGASSSNAGNSNAGGGNAEGGNAEGGNAEGGNAGGGNAGEGNAEGGSADGSADGDNTRDNHPSWWDNLKSYTDISGAVKKLYNARKEAAIEDGREYVQKIQERMLGEVRKLADQHGHYEGAEALGLTAVVGGDNVHVPPECTNLARECSNMMIKADVTGGRGNETWCITVPVILTVPQRGDMKLDDRVADMMKRVGVPEKAFENLGHKLSDEEREDIRKLKPGVRFYVQIFKALEVAVFFNFNFTPGISYVGTYLDVGFVLPIIVANKPLGLGGAATTARHTKTVVLPLWVRGRSFQIYGNRREDVSTAGIVIR